MRGVGLQAELGGLGLSGELGGVGEVGTTEPVPMLVLDTPGELLCATYYVLLIAAHCARYSVLCVHMICYHRDRTCNMGVLALLYRGAWRASRVSLVFHEYF